MARLFGGYQRKKRWGQAVFATAKQKPPHGCASDAGAMRRSCVLYDDRGGVGYSATKLLRSSALKFMM